MSEQTFEQFIAKERARLNKAREEILNKQRALQEQLDALATELHAIDAYEAAKTGKPLPGTGPARKRRASTGTRRSGIRQEIFSLIKSTPAGLTAAEVRERKNVAADDKSGSQSISNALAALKRAGEIRQNDDGKYVAAS